MISVRRLQIARMALQLVPNLQLSSEEWGRVTGLIRRLRQALRMEDDEAVRTVISTLSAMGASRGGASTGGVPSEGTDAVSLELAAELARTLGQLEDVASQVALMPHLDLDMDGILRPGQAFAATVYLDATPAHPGEVAAPLRLPDTDQSSLSVDVWLTASSHFELTSPALGQVEVQPGTDRSTSAEFHLVVRNEVDADAGRPALQARFDYRLRASGSVYREVALEGVDVSGTPDAEVPHPPVVVRPRETAPDLSISVVRIAGSVNGYRVKVATALLGSGVVEEGEWHFGIASQEYVREVMAAFTDDKATPLARSTALRGAGKIFFREAPEAFRSVYWKLVDAGTPPRSMLLLSEERSVPWELMLPERRLPDGTFDTQKPLGAACAIGRWHQDGYFAPGQRIPLDSSLVLAPIYNPKLPKSADERDLVLRLFPGQEVPATFDELDAFYTGHSASLLHFVCHGRDTTLQAIRLAKREYLTAEQGLGGGLAVSCRASRPLVFLNACELGRPGAGLISVGGFPVAFMESGASGMVAPLWSVDDEAAHVAAVTFYEAVRSDPTVPFAEVIRRLRDLGFQRNGHDSYAAYVWYGDPLAAAEAPA